MAAPAGADRPTRFRTVFRAGVIGFAALSILPARVGDLLRPYLVARQDGLPFTVDLRDDRDGAGARPDRGARADGALCVGFRRHDRRGRRALSDGRVCPPASAAPWRWRCSSSCGILASHPERIGTLVHSTERVLPRRIARQLGDLARTFSRGLRWRASRAGFLIACSGRFRCGFDRRGNLGRDAGVRHRLCRSPARSCCSCSWCRRGGADARWRRQLPRGLSFGVTSFFGAPNDRAVAARSSSMPSRSSPWSCSACCSWRRTASASAASRRWPDHGARARSRK